MDASRFGGGTTAHQAAIERKRAAIRQALRHEFLKVYWNPNWFTNETRPVPFDTGFARYMAMDNTVSERGPPVRFRTIAAFTCMHVIPIGLLTFYFHNVTVERHNRFITMQTPYDDFDRMSKWLN